MNDSEKIAKRVLETILPGASLEFRQTQSNGEYDFDLHYRDGGKAAVEVTAAMDETLMKTVGAIHGKRAGGSTIQAKICKKSWIIFTAYKSSIPKIRTDADSCLAELEKEGIDGFSCVDSSSTVQKACCHLGITGGSVISFTGKPTIHIAGPVVGGAVGPSLAIEAGEREALKPDNRQKLGAAGTDERHLVVYVDVSYGLAWTALTSLDPPANRAKLPQEITNLWLIAQGNNTNEFVVWRAGAKETWQSMKVHCAP